MAIEGRQRARLSRLLAATASASVAGRPLATSAELGAITGIAASQIRQDLRRVGVAGKRGAGYAVRPLMRRLQERLGAPTGGLAVVGTGGLALGLLESPALAELGIEVSCVFEDECTVNGSRPVAHDVLPFGAIEREVGARGIDAAVIATDRERAHDAYERLCSAGVRVVVCFTDSLLEPRPGVAVHRVAPAGPLCQAVSATLAGRRARSSASRAASAVMNSRN